MQFDTSAVTLETLRVAVEHTLKDAKHTLDAFAEDFAKDPVHALDWGQDVFRAAAIQETFGHVHRVLLNSTDEQNVLQLVAKMAYQELLRTSRVQQSTSTSTNEMQRWRAEAWNRVLRLFERGF